MVTSGLDVGIGVGVGVGVGVMAVGVTITRATGAAVSPVVNDLVWSVTFRCPTAKGLTWSRMAPVERAGSRKIGMDCVGAPSRPTRFAVTGPLTPMMAAV